MYLESMYICTFFIMHVAFWTHEAVAVPRTPWMVVVVGRMETVSSQ